MKKKSSIYFLSAVMLSSLALGFTACSDDDPDEPSIITEKATTENAFDRWLYSNFVVPYNIDFQYRYDDNESDMQYYDVPADMAQSIELAHIVKYACVEAYTEVAGIDFTRNYFPKQFSLLGEFEYENNNTIKLGTAEGGKKIRLLGVNYLDYYLADRAYLDEYYLKTIHHEFTHILNQTKDYPREFDEVTPSSYVRDSWSTSNYSSGYLRRGFITAYSQSEAREDFAEMVSTYVITTPGDWNSMLQSAYVTNSSGRVTDSTGHDALVRKLEICKQYFQDTFGIDLDDVRDEVVARETQVVEGKVNLTSLE